MTKYVLKIIIIAQTKKKKKEKNMASTINIRPRSPYKVAIIVNQYSSGGSYKPLIAEEFYNQINKFQLDTGHNMAISFSRTRTHIAKAVTSLQREGCNMFIICGGDGTINDVIQNMNEGNVIIPIPAGNANDFARRVNIFHWRDTIQAVKNILNGSVNLIGLDIGEVCFKNKSGEDLSRKFINNCGIGVTADTVKRVDGQISKDYIKAGFFSLMLAKAFGFTFYSKIKKQNIYLKTIGMEILLCDRVGRRANFAPYKHQNDESLHFLLFKKLPLLKKLMLMALLNQGAILVKSKLVEYFHNYPEISETNSLGLTTEGLKEIWTMFHEPTLMHTDGNLVPEFNEIAQTDCKIKLLPKYFKSIAPC